MLLMKQRSNGARARHALVKEIVMYVIGINVLQFKIKCLLVFKCEATENVLLPAACFFIIPGKRNVKSTSFDEKNPEVTFVFINKK